MKYHVGDKLMLCEIECRVIFISASGKAYLVPEDDGEMYNKEYTLRGVAFAILDKNGKDKLGNKAVSIINQECGAV